MKKIISILSLPLLLTTTTLFSQQDPQFSQSMNNKLFMNPAFSGIREALCFTAIYRNQWNGFDGAPNSGVFSGDIVLPDNKGGIGMNLMVDKLGFESNLGIQGNYSYHVPLRKGTLGIGASLGSFSKRVGPTGSDQWIATSNWQNDITIPPQLKKTVMDLGFGLWYQSQNLWGGISTSHLNGKTIDDGTQIVSTSSSTNVTHNLIFQMARHYYITGGAKLFPLNTWQIKPSFLIKTDATITTFDVNVTAVYNKRFWFGASYRYQDAICPMVGFMVPGSGPNEDLGLKVGFAYDYTTSHLKNYNNGSFEVFLNYCVPFDWKHGIHFDVRDFH